MNPDRFTEKAQQALAGAQALATRMQHGELDAEHVLLSLLEQEEGLVPQLVKRIGVEPSVIHEQVGAALGDRPRITGGDRQLYMSPRARRVLT
ncbi:hypothetical protein FJY70_05060, partial [candidate division WOR-3 bacterium]|nr:hypothetical protein [candidate division WOR-3 bacterium]